MELEVEQKGLKGAARFIQPGLQPAGVNWGEGKGWTAGQTKPLLLHFCPSGQTPTLYTRALPSFARLVHSLPPRPAPRNPSMLRRVVLSVRYFSSSLINGTVASLASLASSRRMRPNSFPRVHPPQIAATLSLLESIQVQPRSQIFIGPATGLSAISFVAVWIRFCKGVLSARCLSWRRRIRWTFNQLRIDPKWLCCL